MQVWQCLDSHISIWRSIVYIKGFSLKFLFYLRIKYEAETVEILFVQMFGFLSGFINWPINACDMTSAIEMHMIVMFMTCNFEQTKNEYDFPYIYVVYIPYISSYWRTRWLNILDLHTFGKHLNALSDGLVKSLLKNVVHVCDLNVLH